MSEIVPFTKASPVEIAEALDKEVPAEAIAKAIAAALTAETITKSGVRVIDHRSRLEGARLALAYKLGLPVQRSESVTIALDADSALGIEERLAKSPALREQLRRSLAEADARASAGTA